MRKIGRLWASAVPFRRVLSVPLQLFLMVVANRAAFVLRFDNGLPNWASIAWWQMLPWLIGIRALTFIPFRLYEGLWRYTSIYDLGALIGGISVSSLLFYGVVHSPLGPHVYPRSVFVTDGVLLMLLLGGIRLARRLVAEFSRGTSGKRVLIFGAGDAGELIVRDMKSDRRSAYRPVGFVDDDRTKTGLRIHGVPVLGTRHDLPAILEQTRPDEILLAVPRADPGIVRAIVRALEPYKVHIKTLPNLRDIIDGKVELGQIRSLAVEDLLTRAPVGLDPEPVKRLIAGRRVMVTGAGGSIGSELCRQIARLRPAALVLFDRYENSLHAIRMELKDLNLSTGVYSVVGDITDSARINEVLRCHQPDIIFHAAAHKHVPLMEENPCEAIKNNVRGTRMLAQAAEGCGVSRFVMISTDKAVNPTSVMGASKRVAEMVVQAQAVGSGTSYSIVRFGNVLGSNGSVVPRFVEQIKKGGPVTITHPDMRRFFMLIPEAVQLVLHAASQAEGGSTYVLEMGEQVKLLDMARDLIRLSGLVPEEDIKIEFIGPRPGEKLYEELVGPDEESGPSRVDKILRVRSLSPPAPNLLDRVHALEADAADGNSRMVLKRVKELTHSLEPASVLNGAGLWPPAHGPAASTAEDQRCPSCSTGRVHRSRVRTLAERVRKELTSQRPFRCEDCGWRGWLMPAPAGDHPPLEQPVSPDLASLDSAVGPFAGTARRGFSPRNLN
jgi:FlaA1/EpsC-like NDP-sugar epimerase